MKRCTTLALGAVIAATLFAGCGDDAKSGSGSDAAYCARIAAYLAKSDELDGAFTGTPDPAKVEQAFTTMQSMVHDLNDGAPDTIKGDVATMTTAIDSVVEIFGKYDWNFTVLASSPEFAQLQEDLGGADMQGASDRLNTYSEETCGIVDTSVTAAS
jgi:outer membrane murein-binding lipoprotein Lpp